jgi:NADH:ubiquinone oxidoreductase subunit 6 (subunit J)
MAQGMGSVGSSASDGGRAGAGDQTRHEMTPSQWLALITSIAFIGVGLAGFVVTGFSDFAVHDSMKHVLIFEVNPLHNIVHLALGIVGLALFRRTRGALTYGIIVAAAYAGAFIYGLFAVGTEWDVLSLNWEDNWLHLGLAALGGLIAGLAAYELSRGADRAPAGSPSARYADRGPAAGTA